MPAPDPSAVWFDRQVGRITVSYLPYFWTQKVGHRKARAMAILKRMSRGDWICPWCQDDLPDWRRSDARYCCEGCRTLAARSRRRGRRGDAP